MTINAYEVNFDGLVGMTHTFGGLSLGNEPSIEHEGEVSNPRLAALQGLNKMKFLHSLGIKQAVLPPHERPHLPSLRRLGFTGTVVDILNTVKRVSPWILPQVSSSAAMWTANAATVSPSIDSSDSHLHVTPANLATYFHRSMESETNRRIFRALFTNPIFFEHHDPLPPAELFFDEGAANHTRFCKSYGSPGVQLFSFGKCRYDPEGNFPSPAKYPARQTKEASEAISHLHRLYPGHMSFAFQNPNTIDKGGFHADLFSLGNQNVFLVHEQAFWKQKEVLENLKQQVLQVCDTELNVIEIQENQFPLSEALQSYFFNSQLITLYDQSMALITPESCKLFPKAQRFIQELLSDPLNPIGKVHYVDLSESLKNGGGPACLRLRIVLNSNELAEMNPGVLFTDDLFQELSSHINKFYPDHLTLQDLADPKLYQLSIDSLDAISKILKVGNVYSFQIS